MTKIVNKESDHGCAGLNGARLLAAERLRSVSSVRIEESSTRAEYQLVGRGVFTAGSSPAAQTNHRTTR